MSKYTPVANPMSRQDIAALATRARIAAACARHNAAMYARRAAREATVECELADDPPQRRNGWGYADDHDDAATAPRKERA